MEIMPRIVNPFTPAFGGKPNPFFGRAEELLLMRTSLKDDNSPRRAIFLTGTRWCGKTALLERLSAMARHYGWRCIDVHSTHASEAIVRQLVRASIHTEEHSSSPSDAGFSLGSTSVSDARTYDDLDLSELLLSACRAMPSGKGVMLILADLPGLKETISSYAGCTFMQRAPEVKLSSLLVSETYEAFEHMLADAAGCTYGTEVVAALSEASKGHPYLMQLLGYYLEALGSLLDDQRRASTSAIARTLGKTEQQCSSYRQRLIDRRIIVASDWGYVSYGLPYLDRYFERPPEPVTRTDTWLN